MQWAERGRGGGHDRRPMWKGGPVDDPRAALSSYYEQILSGSPHPNDPPAGPIPQSPPRQAQRQPPPPRQPTMDFNVREVATGRASAQERLEAMRVATRQAKSPSRRGQSPLHKPPGTFSATPSVAKPGPPRPLDVQGPPMRSPPPRLDATPDELREHFQGVFGPPRGPDLEVPLSPSDLSGLWALKVLEVQGADALGSDWASEIVGRSPSFLPSPSTKPRGSSPQPAQSRHGHRPHKSPQWQRRTSRSPTVDQRRVPGASQATPPGGPEACRSPSVQVRTDAWDMALQRGQVDIRPPFVHDAPRPLEERPPGHGMPRRAWSASTFPQSQQRRQQQQPQQQQQQQQQQRQHYQQQHHLHHDWDRPPQPQAWSSRHSAGPCAPPVGYEGPGKPTARSQFSAALPQGQGPGPQRSYSPSPDWRRPPQLAPSQGYGRGQSPEPWHRPSASYPCSGGGGGGGGGSGVEPYPYVYSGR